MTQSHQPDPEFVSRLEWQVRTALRREDRFSRPTQSRSGGRMKIVTLALVSALFGAGGMAVKDEVQEARRQQILLAEVAGNQELARMEMDLLLGQLQEVHEQYQNGLVQDEELLAARLAVTEVESRLDRLALDEQEIRATGQAPDNSLSAPLVEGQDLVTERLRLRESLATEELNLVLARMDRVMTLRDSGVVGEEEILQARASLQDAESRVRHLERQMDLRLQVLEGAITGTDAERQVEIHRLRGELQVLEESWRVAAMQLSEVEEQVARGVVQESRLRSARIPVVQLETRMEIIRMKLEILEEEAGQS